MVKTRWTEVETKDRGMEGGMILKEHVQIEQLINGYNLKYSL